MIPQLLKYTILSSILLYSTMVSVAFPRQEPDPDKLAARVDSVLSLMTLREKIGQLNQYSVGAELTGPGPKMGRTKERLEQFRKGEVGSVLSLLGAKNTQDLQKEVVENSRLGIPLIFAYDVIHGYKTMFPIPLAETSSWDMEALELSARVAAKETAASGVNWTFAPMVDVGRDPRWGRVMEGSGEDTYLSVEAAKARVKGFQGEDLRDNLTIAACAKHFAGYGFVEGGRDYNNVYIGRNTLMNIVMPPFKAASDMGVASFMNAFNDIDGVPATSNNFLLRDILKDKWNFQGLVVSDWGSIGELGNHGVAKDKKEAARLAITAGTDVDMEATAYIDHLESLVNDGVVSESLIDDAVKRVLRVKFQLGLMDDPYKYSNPELESELILNPSHLAASRDVAKKSIVLLKNEKSLLPLKVKSKIGLIGPLAKDKDTPLGNWRAQAKAGTAVSLYEGLVAEYGESAISYAEGCKLSIGPNEFIRKLVIEENDRSGFEEALEVAKNSEVVLMALGEPAYMSGEARSRSKIGLPGLQLELLQEVYKVNQNIVLVLMNGRPLTIPWEAENIPAILEVWHLGSEAGNAIADVLSGKYNPSGKLPMSFPRNVGQIPVYYNQKNSGRPSSDLIFYVHNMDVENSPLYPFGFGLSYTTFDYSDLKIDKSEISTNGEAMVSVEVTNTGEVAGRETVQLYIRDMVSTVTRPILELKGFQQIDLAPGETKTVEFSLGKEQLGYYNGVLDFVVEPGDFEVYVGGSSHDTKSIALLVK